MSFWRNQDGVIAIKAGLSLTLLFGFAALGVDVGNWFYDKRRLQTATDIAAMVAAQDVGNARLRAARSLADNGFGGASIVNLEVGRYVADPSVPVGQRFVPGAAAANAVRLTTEMQSPKFFGKVISSSGTVPVGAAATGVAAQRAAFSVGSRLASLNDGLLNGLLGALTGSTISLSLMDYRALADARIDLFDMLDALKTEAQLTAVTYDQVLAASVTGPQFANAVSAALRAAGYGSAVTALTRLTTTRAPSLVLSRIIDPGPDGRAPLQSLAGKGPKVSALDLLKAGFLLASGRRQIEFDAALSIPGLTSVKVQLAIGEHMQRSRWLAIGGLDATVHTAQTRLLIDARLKDGLGLAGVHVPLYVEVAPATGTLTQLTCHQTEPSRSSVTINVGIESLGGRVSVANAFLGVFATDVFNNTTRLLTLSNLGYAAIARTLTLQVEGRGFVEVGRALQSTLRFTQADIDAGRLQTVGSGELLRTIVTSLVPPPDLRVPGLSLLSSLADVLAPVRQFLSAAVTPVDQLVDALLQTLGVGIGEADVMVHQLRCDGAALAQ